MSMITEFIPRWKTSCTFYRTPIIKPDMATNIIGGLSVGMESVVAPILVLASGITVIYFAGIYGMAYRCSGMMDNSDAISN